MATERRNSRQRTLILEAVQQSHSHPNAEEVYRAVQQQIPGISLGTVYRNLNLLEEMGAVRRIHSGIGGDRFDAVTKMHPHLICNKCGRVYDLEYPTGQEAEQLCKIFAKSGAQIHEVQIQACGICQNCLNELREE